MKKGVIKFLSIFLVLTLSLFNNFTVKAENLEENAKNEEKVEDYTNTLKDEVKKDENLNEGQMEKENSENVLEKDSSLIDDTDEVDNLKDKENSKTEEKNDSKVENEDFSDEKEVTNYSISRDEKLPKKDKKILDKISKMSIEEKIGQMMMLEFRNWEDENGELKPVTELNDDIKEAITKYHVGGIILFAENVQNTEQTTRLTHSIQKAAIDKGLDPLLISIDQEGGIVVRLGTGTSLPGNMALGATMDKKLAYEYGKIIAEEIKALGINVNLAPVLDVNNNPNNPVIGLRSISSDPKLVAEIGGAILKGLQDSGVSAAVKHFPGHGDTAVDSHLGLPEVDKSLEEVEKNELIPFKKASEEDVDMIMTAHISYPKLEKDKVISKKDGTEIGIPATLSDDILTGIVRERLNYKGIIITDALQMKAIVDHFGEEDAVVMAIKAGVDIPLMPALLQKRSDLLKLNNIYNRIINEIKAGNIKESQIDESVYRILNLKSKRNILDLSQYDKTVDEKIENAKKVVGSEKHFNKQREITQKAITVTKNLENALPLYPKANEKVLIYTPYDNEIPGFKYGFEKLQSEGVIDKDAKVDVKSFFEYKDNPKHVEGLLREYAKEYDYIIAVSEISNANNLKKDHWISLIPDMLTSFAKENNKKSTIISIGKPYDLDRYKNSDAHLLAYGAKGMDPTEKGKDPVKTFGPNIPFSLDIVFGKVKSSGRLPVDVPELDENFEYKDNIAYKLGFGLVTKLRDEEIKDESDSEDTKEDINKDVENIDSDKENSKNEKLVVIKDTKANKDFESKDINIVQNENKTPKTGVTTIRNIIITLILSSLGLFLLKKFK